MNISCINECNVTPAVCGSVSHLQGVSQEECVIGVRLTIELNSGLFSDHRGEYTGTRHGEY